MAANLAAAALADPVLGAQSIFRGVLDAMAHPGSIVTVNDLPPRIDRLAAATNGILLTLADSTTPIWLAPSLATDDTVAHLRFQCGRSPVADPARAMFAVIDYERGLGLGRFDGGTPEYPDRSATVIVQVTGFGGKVQATLRGPGIDGSQAFFVDDMTARDWQAVRTNHERFPLGVDLIFVAGHRIAAIPRSTRVEL